MQSKEIAGDHLWQIAVPFMAAATSNAGGCGFKAPFKAQITAATLTWSAAITGAASNNFTVSFFNRAAGAGTVQFATAINYANGTNASKATPITLTLSSTASDLVVAQGDYLVAELSTTGTGLLCPGGVLTITARLLGA